MLTVHPRHIAAVQRAEEPAALVPVMQEAMKLEHATIPAYLTATMSIKPGTNANIQDVIQSVVIEEMLHLSITCNIINALDGKPAINDPKFIPDYPGPLPLGIGDLTVGLNALSLDVVKDTFMAIEEPEKPKEFPVKAAVAGEPEEEEYKTIGQFYAAVQEKIEAIVPGDMPGDPSRQMTKDFPSDELYPIRTGQDAINAIELIVEQGEGTSQSPLDPEGEPAHYYRFAEIYHGKKLVKDDSVPQGFSYSGDALPLNLDGVYPLYPNTKMTDITAGSEAYYAAVEFREAYSRLLNALHLTFNGQPDYIDTALGMMYDVKLAGDALVAMPLPGRPEYNVGPVFTYARVTG